MTAMLGKLCSLLLTEVFGETVAEVGSELHDWNGRTLPQLLTSGKPRVREALAVLIQHNIVTFSEGERSGRAEYAIHQDRVNLS
jgi:RNA polymerase III subunit RPC82 helix-turn-helix domain